LNHRELIEHSRGSKPIPQYKIVVLYPVDSFHKNFITKKSQL
jgi:hypothetical protein